ncbi:MAG: hypothetical protein ABIR87_06505 [Sphingomicrobium sp.]
MRNIPLLLILVPLAGCATSTANEPSLAQRPAELIDPRLPLPAEAPTGVVAPALADRLGQLMAEGDAGARAFSAQLGSAEALAAAAGPAQSESWIVAQTALSGLEAARAKTTAALAEIDAIASARIAGGAGMSPADLAAVAAASGALGAIADHQSATIDQIGARLR